MRGEECWETKERGGSQARVELFTCVWQRKSIVGGGDIQIVDHFVVCLYGYWERRVLKIKKRKETIITKGKKERKKERKKKRGRDKDVCEKKTKQTFISPAQYTAHLFVCCRLIFTSSFSHEEGRKETQSTL